MENVKKSYFNIAAKWAVIYTITSIIIVYIFQFTGVNMTTSPLRFVSYIFSIAFLLLAQKEYKDELGGFMTFGQGFMVGFVSSVIVGVLSAIFIYIYFSFLSPQMWEQILASTREQMEAKGNLSTDQIDQAMTITTKYGVIITAVVTIFASPFMGAIISLIGAAIFKKERSIEDIERETPTSYPDSAV
jgi:hypothetical protein